MAGEREGEAQWELLRFDLQLVHEVGQALGNVVKQLRAQTGSEQEGRIT